MGVKVSEVEGGRVLFVRLGRKGELRCVGGGVRGSQAVNNAYTRLAAAHRKSLKSPGGGAPRIAPLTGRFLLDAASLARSSVRPILHIPLRPALCPRSLWCVLLVL